MTPLTHQLIHIPFAGGQHDKDAKQWLDVGNQANVQNGLWVKRNQISKRPGTIAASKTEIVSGIPNLVQGRKLYSLGAETGVIDGQWLRAYSPTVDRFVQRDEVSNVVATREGISGTESNVYDSDIAEAAGYRAFVWSDSINFVGTGGLEFAIIDTSNNATVLNGPLDVAHSGYTPKLVVLNSNVLACFYRDHVSTLYVKTIVLTATGIAAGWSSATSLTALLASATSPFEVTKITSNANLCALIYESPAGTINLATLHWSGSAITVVTTATVAGVTGSGFTAFGIRGDSNDGYLYIAWSDAGPSSVKVAVHNPATLTQTQAPYTLSSTTGTGRFIGIERLTASSAIVVMGSRSFFEYACVAPSTTVPFIAPRITYSIAPLSKPFAVNSLDSGFINVRVYMLAANAFGSFPLHQTTQFLLELDVRNNVNWPAHPVATVAPRFSYFPQVGVSSAVRSDGSLANVNNFGDTTQTKYITCGTVGELTSFGNNSGRNGLTAITFDFAHPGLFMSASLGDSLYLAGGVPSVYDGTTVAELGSLFSPDTGTITISNQVGGSLTASQTYTYVFVPEWYDAKGNRHQGQPTLPVSGATTGVNKKLLVSVGQISLTTKTDIFVNQNYNNFTMVPYRTSFLGGAMSTVYYRIWGTNTNIAFGIQPENLNLTFTDDGTGNFAEDGTAETLYTTGGILESDCPPSFTTLCSHKNRIYGIGDDERTVYFSTEYTSGQVVRFNDALTFTLADMGKLVACWSMDDKLFIASRTKIVYFTGSGPNETGQDNDLQGPFRIATDVGCIDPRSVVVTQAGTFFQSNIGITLLDRGLSVQSNVGDDIGGVLSDYPFITSAVQHQTRPEIWFTCSQVSIAVPGFNQGTTAVYNYRFNTWSRMVHYDADRATLGTSFNSALGANGNLYLLTPSGQMYTECTNLLALNCYRDAGTQWVTTDVTSAWIKPGGLQGFARMWKAQLGIEYQEPCDLTLLTATDYNSSSFQISNYPSTEFSVVGPGNFASLEQRLVNQKGEAYQFRIVDAAPVAGGATLGRGVLFTGLTCEMGVKDRANRALPGRRA